MAQVSELTAKVGTAELSVAEQTRGLQSLKSEAASQAGRLQVLENSTSDTGDSATQLLTRVQALEQGNNSNKTEVADLREKVGSSLRRSVEAMFPYAIGTWCHRGEGHSIASWR